MLMFSANAMRAQCENGPFLTYCVNPNGGFIDPQLIVTQGCIGDFGPDATLVAAARTSKNNMPYVTNACNEAAEIDLFFTFWQEPEAEGLDYEVIFRYEDLIDQAGLKDYYEIVSTDGLTNLTDFEGVLTGSFNVPENDTPDPIGHCVKITFRVGGEWYNQLGSRARQLITVRDLNSNVIGDFQFNLVSLAGANLGLDNYQNLVGSVTQEEILDVVGDPSLRKYYIDGVLTITDELNLDFDAIPGFGPEFLMAPGSSIIVGNGGSFGVKDAIFEVCGTERWTGIEVQDGGILSLNSVEMNHPETAVYAESGAFVSLVDSKFDDFDIGLHLDQTGKLKAFEGNEYSNGIIGVKMENIADQVVKLMPLNPTKRNSFVQLEAGIDATNCGFIISGNDFENIATTAIKGVNTVGIVQDNTVTTAIVGIDMGLLSSVDAIDNTVTDVETGIRYHWNLPRGRFNVIKDNQISAHKYGVNVSYLSKIEINQNTLSVLRTTLDSEAGGIYATGIFDASLINNTIDVSNTGPAILMEGLCRQNLIQNNTIALFSQTEGEGISLAGTRGDRVGYNLLTAPPVLTDGFNYGVVVDNGSDILMECNEMEEFSRFIQVQGNSASIPMRGNTLSNGYMGLYLNGSITGEQYHQGNIFDNNQVGAKIENLVLQLVLLSKITYDPVENPKFNPGLILPTTFADDFSKEEVKVTPSFACAGMAGAPGHHTLSISGTALCELLSKLDTTVQDAQKKFLFKYYYYGLIQKYFPNPLTRPICIQSFVNTYGSENPGKLYGIDDAIRDGISPPDAPGDVIADILHTWMESYQQSAPSMLEAERIVLAGKMDESYDALRARDSVRTSHTSTAWGVADSGISGLDPYEPLRASYTTAYDAVLEYLSTQSLATATLGDLRTLAAQCPADHGEAVHIARGVLRAYGEEDTYRDLDCDSLTPRAYTAPSTVQIQIIPNPSSDQIRMSDAAHGAAIRMIDAVGHTVRTIQRYSGEPIPVAELPSGVYHLELRWQDRTAVSKFIKVQ